MNKFTYKELQKISHLIKDEWNDSTTHLIILGEGQQLDLLQVGVVRKILIADYILNQPPNFTLSENWNQGTFPPEETLYIEVVKCLGPMVGVRAKGVNTGITWEGWLPIKGITII